MKIDLSLIEHEPLSFAEELTVPAAELDEDQVGGSMEVRVNGAVRKLDGDYWVDGQLAASGPLSCTRCLIPVPWNVEESYSVALCSAAAAPTDDDVALAEGDMDVVFIEAEELDLVRLAAEQILLALPMRILCSESCKGLCHSCGGNRNLEPGCQCEPEVDPRWAALKDLGQR